MGALKGLHELALKRGSITKEGRKLSRGKVNSASGCAIPSDGILATDTRRQIPVSSASGCSIFLRQIPVCRSEAGEQFVGMFISDKVWFICMLRLGEGRLEKAGFFIATVSESHDCIWGAECP